MCKASGFRAECSSRPTFRQQCTNPRAGIVLAKKPRKSAERSRDARKLAELRHSPNVRRGELGSSAWDGSRMAVIEEVVGGKSGFMDERFRAKGCRLLRAGLPRSECCAPFSQKPVRFFVTSRLLSCTCGKRSP